VLRDYWCGETTGRLEDLRGVLACCTLFLPVMSLMMEATDSSDIYISALPTLHHITEDIYILSLKSAFCTACSMLNCFLVAIKYSTGSTYIGGHQVQYWQYIYSFCMIRTVKNTGCIQVCWVAMLCYRVSSQKTA
jgi:hypothetical protein